MLDPVGKDVAFGNVDGYLIVTEDSSWTGVRKIKRLKKEEDPYGFSTSFL